MATLTVTQLTSVTGFTPRVAVADDRRADAAAPAYRNNSRVAVDGLLLAIVQPRSHTVVVFDARATPPRPLFAVGRYGRQAGELMRPTGVAISARRALLLVSDTDNDRIVAFRLEPGADGVPRTATFAKSVGQHGERPGELIQPAGLALGVDGERLYVCDAGNARVQVFDAALAFTETWGQRGSGPSQFQMPVSIAFDPTDGTVYVSDVGALNVQAFDQHGQRRFGWGTPARPTAGLAPGEFGYPFGLTPRPGGVVVSDTRRQDVQVFRGAALVARWGTAGSEDGQLYQPEGVAVLDEGRVVVIDQGGSRGQIFTPTGSFVVAFPIPAGDLFQPTPRS